MTNVSFSNRSFQRTVRQVRKLMPVLAVILLISVYVISAITEGVFLSTLMVGIKGGAWLSFAIAGAIQATRALLVFFPQLNPNRPTFGYQGETIAIVMGLIAIASILGLVNAVSLPSPVAVSLSILMLAGIGIEVFFLREIRFATELELFADKEHWGELQSYHQAREEFRLFLDGLKDYAPGQLPAAQQPAPAAAPPTPGKGISKAFINALAATPNMTEAQMKKIWSWIDAGFPEDHVLDIVNQMAEENARQKPEPKQPAPDSYNDGKALTSGDIFDLYQRYKDTGVPDTLDFTDEQMLQIRKAAQHYGIDLSTLFPGKVPLDHLSNHRP